MASFLYIFLNRYSNTNLSFGTIDLGLFPNAAERFGISLGVLLFTLLLHVFYELDLLILWCLTLKVLLLFHLTFQLTGSLGNLI